MWIGIFILGGISIVLGIFVFKKQQEIYALYNQIDFLKSEVARYKEEIKNLEKKIEILDKEREEFLLKIKDLEKENIKFLTQLEENEKSFKEKMEIIKKSEENLKNSFKSLANDILTFTQDRAKKDINEIISPFSKEINDFKNKIERLSKEEYSQIVSLKEELKNIKELSYKLSQEANNLTRALKGDKKLQGIWGEVILEKVLELSGLRKGVEYEREVTLIGDNGKKYKPDVIVHLPDNRDIVIDAKVSLNSYISYIESADEKYLKEHVKNLKKHIDTLSSKEYEYLKGINSLDFIFMFVPLENALSEALNFDKELFEYAFKKRVILTSPTTLLTSLRTIEAIWRYERQAENIKEVVKISENLYNKLRLFLEDFLKVGDSIQKARDAFEGAKSKLKDGRGDIFTQINKLKEKAGIKPKKEIKEDRWN